MQTNKMFKIVCQDIAPKDKCPMVDDGELDWIYWWGLETVSKTTIQINTQEYVQNLNFIQSTTKPKDVFFSYILHENFNVVLSASKW